MLSSRRWILSSLWWWQYGKILPQAVLGSPPIWCINVHASLLPRAARRGADPVVDPAGRSENRRDNHVYGRRGLDTGDMLLKAETGNW